MQSTWTQHLRDCCLIMNILSLHHIVSYYILATGPVGVRFAIAGTRRYWRRGAWMVPAPSFLGTLSIYDIRSLGAATSGVALQLHTWMYTTLYLWESHLQYLKDSPFFRLLSIPWSCFISSSRFQGPPGQRYPMSTKGRLFTLILGTHMQVCKMTYTSYLARNHVSANNPIQMLLPNSIKVEEDITISIPIKLDQRTKAALYHNQSMDSLIVGTNGHESVPNTSKISRILNSLHSHLISHQNLNHPAQLGISVLWPSHCFRTLG